MKDELMQAKDRELAEAEQLRQQVSMVTLYSYIIKAIASNFEVVESRGWSSLAHIIQYMPP